MSHKKSVYKSKGTFCSSWFLILGFAISLPVTKGKQVEFHFGKAWKTDASMHPIKIAAFKYPPNQKSHATNSFLEWPSSTAENGIYIIVQRIVAFLIH